MYIASSRIGFRIYASQHNSWAHIAMMCPIPSFVGRFRVRDTNKDDKRNGKKGSRDDPQLDVFAERIRAGNLIHQTYYCTLNQLVVLRGIGRWRLRTLGRAQTRILLSLFCWMDTLCSTVHHQFGICVILTNENPITASSYFANTPQIEAKIKGEASFECLLYK